VIDSPFYDDAAQGDAMIEEKRNTAQARFGTRAAELMALSFIEYLTRERLSSSCESLHWIRHRVRYPLWYEMRPFMARLKGHRTPSRFDVWEGVPA
jgi:hypothetical protein